MKKNIILIIALLLALAAVIFYNYKKLPDNIAENTINKSGISKKETNNPLIKITPEFYDLGTVVYGDIPERIFKIKNTGTKDLEILRLSTSCGCTSAFMEEQDKIIPPGETREMKVSFNPAVHEDDTDLGELTRVIYIKSNDINMPETEVKIMANVTKDNTNKTTEDINTNQENINQRADNPRIIEVIAKNWSFSPNPIRVKQGEKVRLNIASLDIEHGFNLSAFGINESIKPGEVTTVEFVADKQGEFEFYCSVPCGEGHYDMGGMLIVE